MAAGPQYCQQATVFSHKFTHKVEWAETGHEFRGNPTRSDRLSKCSAVWNKLNSRHVSILTDSDSSILEDRFPHSIHIFIYFARRQTFGAFGTSAQVTSILNFENHSNTCVLQTVGSSKATFNISQGSAAFLLSSTQSLMQTHCYFKFATF